MSAAPELFQQAEIKNGPIAGRFFMVIHRNGAKKLDISPQMNADKC